MKFRSFTLGTVVCGDERSGKNYDHRHGWLYQRQRYLDFEEAVLACSIYVDLNPVRANMVLTPEESEFTSLYYRLIGYRARKERRSPQHSVLADCWLAPFFETKLPSNQQFAKRGLRVSDTCGISISVEQYAQLADWTGRQIREGKQPTMPFGLACILERLNIDANLCVDAIDSFLRKRKIGIGVD